MSPSDASSDTVSASPALPRLVPVPVAPASQPPPQPSPTSSIGIEPYDTAAATALRRILALEIDAAVDDKGKPCYQVRVFLQSMRSRIPVPTAMLAGGPLSLTPRKANDQTSEDGATVGTGVDRLPDIVAMHHFAAFRALRDAVYYLAHEGHVPGEGVTRACTFCAGAVDAVLLDQTQPHRYDVWMRSGAAVCSRLEVFLHDLVARARGDPATTTMRRAALLTARPRCAVQARVQTLVVQFLELDQQDDQQAQAQAA